MPFPIELTGHTLIVGPYGSGKTTLARMIAAEYDVPNINGFWLTPEKWNPPSWGNSSEWAIAQLGSMIRWWSESEKKIVILDELGSVPAYGGVVNWFTQIAQDVAKRGARLVCTYVPERTTDKGWNELRALSELFSARWELVPRSSPSWRVLGAKRAVCTKGPLLGLEVEDLGYSADVRNPLLHSVYLGVCRISRLRWPPKRTPSAFNWLQVGSTSYTNTSALGRSARK